MPPSPQLDPTKIFALREIERSTDIPYDLEQLMSNNTPQALLRDLHRPVMPFGVNPNEFDKHERINDGGRSLIREIKETLHARYYVPIHELIDVPKMYEEGIAERHAIMRSKWADAPKFGTQYLPAGMNW